MPREPRHDRDVDQERLGAALNRYLLARATPDAEERSAARLALVAVLAEAGWEPPPAVREALRADEAALERGGRRSA